MRHPTSEGLSRRDLSAFDAADLAGRADAVAKTNVKLKPNSLGLEAKGAPKTNTGIDWNKIDLKMVAFKFAEALLKRMLNGGFGDHLKDTKSAYVKELEVDLGTPCVVSAGKDAGVASKIKIGGERISTLNGKNQVSFKIDHCGGGG